MSNSNLCMACGSVNITTTNFLASRKFPLCTCNECGLSFLDLPDDDEEFDTYWDDVNKKIYTHPTVVKELKNKYLNYFNKIQNLPNKNLLDVGSGAGICVNTANELGYKAMGVEPDEIGLNLSKETYSINVVHDLLRPDDDLPRDFGVLTLWDVIEHVPDPEELVTTCAKHLAEHGYLILETPHEGAFIRKIVRILSRISGSFDLRKNMYYRTHRYYFTEAAMRKLLERCGFDEIHFYKDRSMYEKAYLKRKLFVGIKGVKKIAYKILFTLMKRLPFLQNKMVVVARKSSTT